MTRHAPLRSSLTLALVIAVVGGCDAGRIRFDDTGPDASAEVVFPDALDSDAAEATAAEADLAPLDAPTPDADAPPEAVVEILEDVADAADDEATDATEVAQAEVAPDADGADAPDGTDVTEVVQGCVPNGDGTIEADEVPVVVGAVVSYRVSPVGQVVTVPDLAGAPCLAGVCWDFSAASPGDEAESDPVRPVADFWFAPSFPADAVVVPIDARTGDLAVYQKTAAAFLMLGMASTQKDHTSLVYDPPVTILQFPFQKGSTWATEEARAEGLFEGSVTPDLYGNHVVHTYRFVVTGRGQITVPAGTFPALRLLLDLTMQARNAFGVPYEIPGVAETTHVKVYDFLSECVGLVARVRSTDGEAATFFGQATEYKRLGL